MNSHAVLIDMDAVMLDLQTTLQVRGQGLLLDAAVAFQTSDRIQAKRYSESCIDQMKDLRDKLNELLSQADVAGYREVA